MHIPAKIYGCTLCSRPVMLGSAGSQVPKLIIREIIFAEFQRAWSQTTNVRDRRPERWTDRQLMAIPP